MTRLAPLWSLCSLNDRVLPESTTLEYRFEYVDISNVSQNYISEELEAHTFGSAPSRARRLAKPGDILVSTVRTYLRAISQVEESKDDRVYSTGFAVLSPIEGQAYSRYLSYVLTADVIVDEIVAASTGVSYPAIQGSELHRLRVPHHDVATQRRIADYLDRETSQIDAMIESLDNLKGQLSARKSALSSTFFVGDFDQVKLKWLLDEIDIRAGDRANELPLLSVSIHHGVQLRDGSLTNQNPSENLSHYKVAAPGQIVLNRMRAFQGGLGASKWHGLVSPDYSILQTRDRLTPGWAEFMMRTPEFVSSMTQALRGIGGVDQGNVRTPRINVRDLLELPIPLPPLEEQRRIADHLDEVTGKIDTMLAKVAQLKDLLTERRAALITDVVTGRKDVA